MGWLDALLGKKNARTFKKVQKAISQPPPAPKKPARPALPKLEWHKSDKGNDTTEFEGMRITIFKQDDEWNYCIAEILDEEDIADGLEDDPEFGDGYPTKAAAKKAALEELV